MLRDLRIFRRNSGKATSSEVNQENISTDPSDSSNAQLDVNPSRPPFMAIQEHVSAYRRKVERTPTKSYTRGLVTTPRPHKTTGKASSGQSDTSSTYSTPTKSVAKPSNCHTALGSSRPPLGTLPRSMGLSAYQTVVSTVEVPRFELREDPSFWMDHNVQVVIRVRPLDNMEISSHGYNRCLKQETAQSIVWVGQPEARFTFDHIACESINQEMLFRVAGLPMVENCLSGYNSCMFAYGQTGSGKTYSMLGGIDELEYKPNPERGMTPRIFEFLFARIVAEEESRKDEKLKYSCRCSFLEIYNEQITDLLEPSSTNLLLREDLRKGVYVENLTECEVDNVNEILKLLSQGAANRKVAATNMNRESSRSHSVFTCVIESTWEKDSSTNMRFARLNLVDLAGSERQKASGAEGERLKEAANINKSLSTLGHVIMILSDASHGKQRHIPYRDSRLTFLLQDSLGGNSKTMIIANVSPSICCANETLSTLKFAQRAKLIQNKAVVNEDASGDVIALQHQIRVLKEELSLLRRQNVARSLSYRSAILEECENDSTTYPTKTTTMLDRMDFDLAHDLEASHCVRVSTKQLKSLEAILTGAFRREKMAEATVKQHEAEIEQLNRLVQQREVDSRCLNMMLKFREDKIQRMESLIDGILPKDSYLLAEINTLTEEVQLLQTRVDRNPEVTRFASENIRLSHQLRRFQEFYEEGERELLLKEVSKLRNQQIQFLEGKSEPDQHPDPDNEDGGLTKPDFMSSTRDNCFLRKELKRTCLELEKCRNDLESCLDINEKLKRELNDVQMELKNAKSLSYGQSDIVKLEHAEYVWGTCKDISAKKRKCASENPPNHAEEILNLELELDILKEILKEERSALLEAEKKAFHFTNEEEVEKKNCFQTMEQYENLMNELKDSRIAFEAMESQNLHLMNELYGQKASNSQFVEVVRKQNEEISILKKQLGLNLDAERKLNFSQEMVEDQSPKLKKKVDSQLQKKLRKMQDALEKARLLNVRYNTNQASYTSHEREMEEVREQVEEETAQVIVSLQEELLTLQQLVDDSNRSELLAQESLTILQTEMKELNERLCFVTQDNERLSDVVDNKVRDLRSLSEDWEKLASDIAEILEDGNNAFFDVSDQVNQIACYFPQRKWICHSVEKVIKSMSEKDLLIDQLQKHLEDAQHARSNLEWKLRSIRGATMAITEAQQQDSSDKEEKILALMSELCIKNSIISKLEDKIRKCEHQIRKSELCAMAAFVTAERLSKIKDARVEELGNAKLVLNPCVEAIKKNISVPEREGLRQSGIESQSHDLTRKLELCLSQVVESDAKEQDHAQTSGHDISKEDGEGISSITDSINELKVGLTRLHYSLCEFPCQVGGLTEEYSPGKYSIKSSHEGYRHRLYSQETGDVIENEGFKSHVMPIHSKESPSIKGFDDKFGGPCSSKNNGIALLKVELESALDILKTVQQQMGRISKFEMQNQLNLEHLAVELVRLKSDIDIKESKFSSRLQEVDHNLHRVEETAVATTDYWHKAKEALELEVNVVKAVAAQKTVETAYLLARIEEAQETMREADTTVNALLEAREYANNEIKRLQRVETMLSFETNCLRGQLRVMEKEHQKSLSEAIAVVVELENSFSNLKSTFSNDLVLLNDEVSQLKIQVQTYTNSARSSLVQIWSEIIGKACSVSILHLCQTGTLLERIIGLTAENGLLRHGLCHSQSVIADLKEHNVREEKELHMCSILNGKLPLDISNSCHIAKGEAASHSDVEEKIFDLQLQEDSILRNMLGRDFELFVLRSELRQLVAQCNTVNSEIIDMKQQNGSLVVVLNKLTEHLTLQMIDNVLKNNNLDYLLEENEKLNMELLQLKMDHCEATDKLKGVEIRLSYSINQGQNLEQENYMLKYQISSLQASVDRLGDNLDLANMQLGEVKFAQSIDSKELNVKSQVIENQSERVLILHSEILALEKKVDSYDKIKLEAVSKLYDILCESLDKVAFAEETLEQIYLASNSGNILLTDIFLEISKHKDMLFLFNKELENLELSFENMIFENSSLRSELIRKDEVVKGLMFDMSLLQEAASITADRRGELHAMKPLEDEIASKSCELDKALAEKEVVEAQLMEKSELISALQLENSEKHGMLCQVSTENLELRAQVHEILQLKNAIEEELVGKANIAEKLEEELCKMSTLLAGKTQELEASQRYFSNHSHDRDYLNTQIFSLREKLDIANALAEENEAIAMEAQQIAEGRKAYAEDKEEEVKLLEKSVEELEHTVDALENKVDIIKGEAERQQSQREQLEKELEAMRSQLLSLRSSAGNADISRHLEEKMGELQEAQKRVTLLQKEAAEKNAQISQCKSYISELNMHADAQAREYKRKFKELEVMALHMNADRTSGASSQASSKSEKATKPRGSGSPFKCIGLVLTEQIKSEKDEDLSAARCRIEELEALVATRQKEIFTLNARLAAAESMTHDVIRDLLGVKLDMTNYATLLDQTQVERAAVAASSSCKDGHDKEIVVNLEKQLHELIQDRRSWLDEVNKKQAELMAAQIKVEKLRQRIQLLTAENDMLKTDNAKHNKMVMELEDEISKLTSQRNLQLRIHHHSKIKEENNFLKAESEDLHAKLTRQEVVLSHVREELASYRALNGKRPYIDFDNEEQLQKKLDEVEGEREQLTQSLMNLYANILKVAGLTQSDPNMSVAVAEDALDQLKSRINSLENELVDLKLKCKIYCERIRLFELEQQNSSQCLRVRDDDSFSSASISSP